jgi:hypothetical protein
VRITQGGIVPRKIFGAEGEPVPVASAERARKNELVCFSGGESQTTACGHIVGRTKRFNVEGVPKAGYWAKFPKDQRPVRGDSGGPVWKMIGRASVGLISAGDPTGEIEKILVEPLLTPQKMDHSKVPGVLHHPRMQPLRLKLGG